MDKGDFGCITGMFIALVGVKINFIKADTWYNIFVYIVCFTIVTYILNLLDRKLFKNKR